MFQANIHVWLVQFLLHYVRHSTIVACLDRGMRYLYSARHYGKCANPHHPPKPTSKVAPSQSERFKQRMYARDIAAQRRCTEHANAYEQNHVCLSNHTRPI